MAHSQTPTILIIDNDDHTVRLVSMLLERNGYNVVAAKSGAQGISEFGDGGIDLIITDLNMPMGDGITVVEEIRKASSMPIIILTGFGKEYAQRVRDLPNVTVITKPFNSEALLDLIEIELAARTE